MVLRKPAADGDVRELLALAKEQVEQAIAALRETARELKAQPGMAATDMRKDARLLGGAIQLLAQEKKRIEDCIKEQDGIAGDYALDLAAARAEIRHRLARLRAAAGEGEVSGGTG